MTATFESLASTIDQQAEAYTAWLTDLASIPSVSATGEGIRACAEHLRERMQALDIETEVLETGGAPLVVGRVGSGERRLLLYGHYDVQPAGPPEEWETPPFSPTIREGAIYGRGVGDNKGQLLAHICALDAWRRTTGEPPGLEVVFVFDGEEEVGSPNTLPFVEANAERFRADYVFGADGSTLGIWEPALYLEVHGLLYVELRARGAAREWHSGSYGSILPNPVLRLAHAIASLVDTDGRVLIEGFYDRVREPSPERRRLAQKLPPGVVDDADDYGVDYFTSPSPREAMFLAPKLCLCGFGGGYTGPGVKTSVPTDATAKIDITLAPDQDPEEILHLLTAQLVRNGFADVGVRALAACPPISIDPGHELVRVVAAAMERVWQRPAVQFPSIGGGGPLASFRGRTGTPVLMAPYAQADLHEHSSDEHLSLEWFVNGIKTTAEIYRLMSNEEEGWTSS